MKKVLALIVLCFIISVPLKWDDISVPLKWDELNN